MMETVSYLLFENSTSDRWPFAVPYDRITMQDLSRIAVRVSANSMTEEIDTEIIHACCMAVLGEG